MTKEVIKGSRLTLDEYTAIKTLCDMGVPQGTIHQITGRGAGTISVIKNSASFKEYAAKRTKGATAVEPPKGRPIAVPKKTYHDPMERVAVALERLVALLEAEPVKKGWFK